MGPKFVLYHDVVATAGGDEVLARERFRRHVSAIAESGHRFVRMSDFLGGRALGWHENGDAPLGSRDVVVTVDDGARSAMTVMLPVLEEFGAPMLVFLLTGFMGLSGSEVDFLSWDDVAVLAEKGVEFGCHGVSHVPLDQVDRELARTEISGATETMRSRGLDPQVFAYPFGRCDEESKEAVASAGYDAAFTVMKGGRDRFEIRRRLFTGLEGPAVTRFRMSDRFFGIREAVRSVVPRIMLSGEQPIAPERWGPQAFGVKTP
jgi:peptidoglycan/xylan/chitin deacetylase (PgdA/CDA1 family)